MAPSELDDLVLKYRSAIFRKTGRSMSDYLERIDAPRHRAPQTGVPLETDVAVLWVISRDSKGGQRFNPAILKLDLGRISRLADLQWVTRNGRFAALTEEAKAFLNGVLTPEAEPVDQRDARKGFERVYREIEARRGQKQFRNQLLSHFSGKCVITGCEVVDTLEAAHIVPYAEGRPDRDTLPNGLLLRSDVHTLFDLHLISIDPESQTLSVAIRLRNSEPYKELNGKAVILGCANSVFLRDHFSKHLRKFGSLTTRN